MTKPELEKKIFLHLTKVDFSTSDDMKNIFKCSENDLMDIIKNNTKTNSEPLGFIIKNDETARIQEAHMFIGHWLCEAIDMVVAEQQ